jgi:hypothetical protein
MQSAHEQAIVRQLHAAGWSSQWMTPTWWRRHAQQVLGERVDLITRRGGSVQNLSPLAELTKLRFLYILDTEVRRGGLLPLANLTNLEVLSFKRSTVSDIAPLAGLRNLKSLKLHSTQVRNLTPLASLRNLRELNLAKTPVSDIFPLAGLANLQSLNISNTQVGEADVQVLQRALPNCKIVHDPF